MRPEYEGTWFTEYAGTQRMGGDSPGEEGGKHAPGRAGGINKGPEAGLAESFQGLKEGHPKGMEGAW